ncbi:MAG: DUF948 domain-containing protein [Actinomycetes bacterium]
MSLGSIAGLIAAIAFVLLVGALAVPLVKLGRVFDETRELVHGVAEQTVPLIGEVTETVTTTNAQLLRVDAITANIERTSRDVSRITAALAIAFGNPVIKAASFAYGVRRALRPAEHPRDRGQ